MFIHFEVPFNKLDTFLNDSWISVHANPPKNSPTKVFKDRKFPNLSNISKAIR